MTEQLEDFATDAKNVFLEYMKNAEIITQEQMEELIESTAILFRKPSFFRRLIKSKKEDEYPTMIVVEAKVEAHKS
jgi:membrane peptidoglycan carboxypeptidase